MHYSPPEHVALYEAQEAAQTAYLQAWDELERFKAEHGIRIAPVVYLLKGDVFAELERLNKRYAETWEDWQRKFATWLRVTGGVHLPPPE